MNSLRQHYRMYFRNLFLSLTTGLFFLGSLSYWIYFFVPFKKYNTTFLDPLRTTLELSLFAFVGFLFLAYEYGYRAKKYALQECLSATRSGFRKYFICSFVVLSSLLLLYALVFLLFNLFVYWQSGIQSLEYALHILQNIVLNLLLVPLVGILFGLALTFLKKRLSAYAIIFLLCIIASPIGEIFASQIDTSMGLYVFRLWDFFNIFPPALRWADLFSFGFSVLAYRWQLVLVWLFALLAIILLLLNQNRKRTMNALAILLVCGSLAAFAFYVQPASAIKMSVDPVQGATADAWYYEYADQQEKPADFQITRYDMNLHIDRQLEASVTLSPDVTNLTVYEFTLYHGYRIQEVRDDSGRVLPFTQDGDYVTVENSTAQTIRNITMEYSGSAIRFFSNRQGTSLPGYFTYYPRSGFHEVFSFNAGQGFIPCIAEEPVEFHISVDSPRQIYCNLPQTGDGSFQGKATACTLMSGFLKTMNVDGIEVVYPYLNQEEFNTEEIQAQVNLQRKNGIIGSNIKQIFILPNTNLSGYYEAFSAYSDHLDVKQLLSLELYYQDQKTNPKKYDLYSVVNSYQSSPEYFEEMVQLIKAREILSESGMERYVLFSEKVHQLGADFVLEESLAYIADDNDTRTVDEFLNELKKQAEVRDAAD